MTQIGIVRNLDSLGRIVIRPHRPGCIFCGSELGVKSIHNVNVCRQCAMEMPGVFGEATPPQKGGQT